LTGCLHGDGEETDQGGDGDEPTVSEREIRTNSAECASSPSGGHSISINSRDGVVILAGVISAPNPCHRAELSGAEYDSETDSLTVTVEAVEEDVDSCQECLGAIDYNADITFSGGMPGEVTVNHDGEFNVTEKL